MATQASVLQKCQDALDEVYAFFAVSTPAQVLTAQLATAVGERDDALAALASMTGERDALQAKITDALTKAQNDKTATDAVVQALS
jgi:hypothetical protein